VPERSPGVLVRGRQLARVYQAGNGSVTALAEASFEIRGGDQIALTGPSGSGKTSLLHLISAIDQPSSGEIAWPALGPPARLRPAEIAIAFQGPSLLPPLTVQENVALPALLAGRPEADAAADARLFLGRLGLSEVAGKLPEEISGGQAQRAGLARALAARPRLILADEPTGQLDRSSAARLMNVLLEQVEQSGTALLVATHDDVVADRLPLRWQLRGQRLDTTCGVVPAVPASGPAVGAAPPARAGPGVPPQGREQEADSSCSR
jgi:putative ABC transport system ATP-binding protein